MLNQKDKILILVILCLILSLGIFLVIKHSNTAPELFVEANDFGKAKCIKEDFVWNKKQVLLEDKHIDYKEENIIHVKPSSLLTFSNSKKLNMIIEEIKCFDKDLNEVALKKDNIDIGIQKRLNFYAPNEFGTYIYNVRMNYEGRGVVNYSVKVVVLLDITKLETYLGTYIGDNSKVSKILDTLPFNSSMNGIEIISSKEPYSLIINYKDENITMDDLKFNTISLFTLIKNLGRIVYNIESSAKITEYKITREEILKNNKLSIDEIKKYTNNI